MKAVSPIISAVLVVAIIFGIAAMTTPWMFGVTEEMTNKTQESQQLQLICQNTAYDFDSNYGTYGANWNLTTTDDTLDVKIINTGSVNVYNFSIEIVLNTTTELEIEHISINESYQKTGANPLRPGQSAILKANITKDLTGTMQEVKVLNTVCPSFYVSQTV